MQILRYTSTGYRGLSVYQCLWQNHIDPTTPWYQTAPQKPKYGTYLRHHGMGVWWTLMNGAWDSLPKLSFHTSVVFALFNSYAKVVNTKQLKSDIQATMDKPLDSRRSHRKQQIWTRKSSSEENQSRNGLVFHFASNHRVFTLWLFNIAMENGP